MFHDSLEILFRRWRTDADMRALARTFDVAAPQLMTIALHLARTRDEAEDLVQATFLTALERGESYDGERPLLPWLAGVLAMHARKARERGARTAGLAEIEPTSGEDPERDASMRELASAVESAVAALPANYAPIVRHHLVGGATTRELAREFGLSETNVRTRLHRGLRLLRDALPAGFSRDTSARSRGQARGLRAMRTVVLTNAAELVGSSVPRFVLGSGALALLTLAPILLLSTWVAVRATQGDSSIDVAVVPEAALSVDDAASAAVEPHPISFVEPMPASSVAARTVTPVVSSDNPAKVRGRLLLPNGTPAVGASLELDGWPSNDELVDRYGVPLDWNDPDEIESDAQGRFEFVCDAPRAFQFALTARDEGCVPCMWRWDHLEAGATLDLGEVTFEPAGELFIRLVDAIGAPFGESWVAQVSDVRATASKDREPYHAPVRFDPHFTGFLVSDAPGSKLRVALSTPLGARVNGEVTCRARETTELTLTYDGPDLSKRIAVRLKDPLRTRQFLPSNESIVLRAPGVEPRNPTSADARATGLLTFDGVEPGVYELELADPRFELWSQSGIQPGTVVQMPLDPNAALRVRLVQPDGSPLDLLYSLSGEVTQTNSQWTTNIGIRFRVRGQAEPVGGLYKFVPGVAVRLKLALESGAAFDIDVSALTPGEVRDVVQVVNEACSIRGRVVDTHGAEPLEAVIVELTRGEIAGHRFDTGYDSSVNGTRVPPRTASTTSASDGSFEFDALTPGPWTVRARWGEFLVADAHVELAQTTVEVELAQPPHGSLVGRLLSPEGVSLERHGLTTWPPAGSNLPFMPSFSRTAGGLELDGTFHIGPFPLAAIAMTLDTYSITPDGSEQSFGMPLGTFQVIEGEPTPFEIDLRESFPGSLVVTCTLDGEAAEGMIVHARQIGGGVVSGATGSTTSAEGVCELSGMTPGPKRIRVFDPDLTWTYEWPVTAFVHPGSTSSLVIDLATFERDVLVLDAATNVPLANFELALRTDAGGESHIATRKTGADGRLRVRIPDTSVHFTSVRDAAEKITPSLVEWFAASDPLVLRVAD